MESICKMYTLQSNDNKVFQVNQKVIDASVLLKNSCEFTDITEPILLNCSSKCLDAFIKVINHYDEIIDVHDTEFEIKLFESFNREDLGKLVEQIGYLDSDFFVEAIADVILDRIEGFSWKEIQAYFDLEDDFTEKERYQIEDNKFEYLIALAAKRLYLQFPLSPCANFMMLKNYFFTPMNVILRQIIERSNEKTSFNLSIINKSIKNEVDRHPIKISELKLTGFPNNHWTFSYNEKPKFGGSFFHASYNETYFQIFIQRKISPYLLLVIENEELSPTANIPKFVFNDFVVVPKASTATLKVIFSRGIELSNCFDIQQWHFSSLFYKIDYSGLNFNLFYQHFILKDLSKEIKINARCADFKFFNGGVIRMFKKANCSKFHEIYVTSKIQRISAEFKNFVLEFMEEDGIIRSKKKIFKINNAYDRVRKRHVFKVSTVKEMLIGL
uniref:BTB domain-containing protein n=1 Tax=Panagrolaimus sp. PS1159 TaxID=55785 RepID=A0AC35FCY6_9BILA